VDPGVGSSRSIVAIRTETHVFLAPDNGILTVILEETSIHQAVSVDNPRYHLTPVSNTFHGRDIFAPAAAHLACGIDFAFLGSPVDPEQLLRLPLEPAGFTEGRDLAGKVVHIDRFGNLVTNIHRDLLEALTENGSPVTLDIIVGRHVIHGTSDSYSETVPGHLMGVIGSREVLEIAVNQGHAASRTGSGLGDKVFVRRVK